MKRALVAATILPVLLYSAIGLNFTETAKAADNTAAPQNSVSQSETFKTYLNKYSDAVRPGQTVIVDVTKFSCSKNYAAVSDKQTYDGKPYITTGDEGYIEWNVNVEEAGLYNINMTYYPQAGKGASIVRKLLIDGSLPFDEAKNLTFTRAYKNANRIKTDANGNQLRPEQIESPIWMNTDFYDTIGYYNEPLEFYFSKGTHTIRFEAIREPLTIAEFKLYQSPQAETYQQALASYGKDGYTDTKDYSIKIQGEDASLKSDNTIYPLNDNSSASTEPSSASCIKLNTIGGVKWEANGQWLEWKFSVPKSGLYRIGIKFRQDQIPGQSSYRALYIDGKLPFREMSKIKFPYNTRWQMTVLQDAGDNPYEFYLSSGTHTMKMEVTLGDIADMVENISESMQDLNIIYRDFLMVIGPSPDTSRDYQFDKLLPGDLHKLLAEAAKLQKIYNEYVKLNGMGGSQSQLIANMIHLCLKMGNYPDKIAASFSDFASDISSLGTWFDTAQTQPLENDYIEVNSVDRKFDKPTVGFWSNVKYSFNQFVASFYRDYEIVSDNTGTTRDITVWITTGRDQQNIFSQMITNSFTPQTKIGVNLDLVAAGTLLTATLAHKGPDVALNLTQSDPMNYAIRGAVVDITQFPDYKEVLKRFQASAIVPLEFNGKIYGLPEAQNFPLMFYRTDILSALHLSVPQTWSDVIAMLPVLQKKNLNFGLPVPFSTGLPVYTMFLYQYGGTLYNTSGSKSELNSSAGINAFYDWASFYTDYSLPQQYDFNNRFRSGAIPIGIADYGTYNALSVFAPELDGLWSFAPVPGTRKADGTIDRSVASTITASVIMHDAKDKQAAWEFLKWWTSASIQEEYGNELESVMGTAARYQTANIEALYRIPWSESDFSTLMQQWKWTKGIREVPGSYMTSRYLDFAIKQVVISGADNPGKVLDDENLAIDNELSAKRYEFGLSD